MRIASFKSKVLQSMWIQKAPEGMFLNDGMLLLRARDAARYQLVQDSLDIWLPITGLELARLNDGILGGIGYVILISSVLMKLVAQCAGLSAS
jgi:hypothetical protein